MPSIRMQNGLFRDLIVLKNKEFADRLRHSILDAFRNYDHIHANQIEGDADE